MGQFVGRALCAALFVSVAMGSGHALAEGPGVEEQVRLCATCHGENGVPINKDTPVIWGQNEGYLYVQLSDFKKGSRKSPVMGPIAAQFDKKQMYALAAYFTAKKWPNLEQPTAPSDIAAKADSAVRSVGCRGCHLDHFQGNGTTARLAGQWQEYLHKQMVAFRDGARGNNPGMSDLMKATPEDDLEALSKYLAGLQIDQYLGHGR